MKLLISSCILLGLSGCATPADRLESAKQHDEAQAKFYSEQRASRKPLVEIKADATGTISGLGSVTVYAPEQEHTYVAAPVQKSDIVEIVTSLTGSTERILTGAVPWVAGAAMVGKMTDKLGNVDNSNHVANTSSSSTSGNSGANSGNSGQVAGQGVSLNTATPTVVNQPAPVVVTQPAPVIVTQPAATQIPAGRICTTDAAGVVTCV